MYNFSIEISDKIANDFESKLKTATTLGINNIEVVDKINGISLHQMNGKQLEEIRDLLIDYGKRIVLYTTYLDVNDKESFNLLFRRALTLNVKGIKIVPKENDDISFVSKLSKTYGIPLLIENNADSFIKDETALKDVIADKNAYVIFNPFEIVRTQRHPFFHAYYTSKIKNNISFLRINDGLYNTHEPIMLYHGCAEVKELASIMLSRSFDGYFSFTPYLPDMTLEQYKECIDTFKKQLKNM
ncbi:MAG: hypothetical protein E7593_04015 [Ruminococcaceae bacterium]|nr:hypothetical protein [Oscillospiraceae bacterium]